MRRKIIVALVLLFSLVSVGAVVASWYVAVATDQLGNLVELHEVEGLRRNLVIGMQTVQSDLYTAHTPMARKLDAIVANVRDLDDAADECSSCHHRPELETQLTEVRVLIRDYKAALSYYITASANREHVARLEREAVAIGTQILQRTATMSHQASETLERITAQAISKINQVRIILSITVGLTIALCIGVSLYLVRSVTDPIGRLVGATRVLASGNLSHRIEDVKEAEFGELATHFNAMGTALEESYRRLEAANEDLRREIKERKQAEKEREELQAQLLHAQKMEALGTLSAGIAHEFGNSVQIIQGCVDILTANPIAEDAGRREIEMIGDATERCGDLTRRILTFGSKVETRSRPIDINEQMRRMETILDRTLPETIEIQVSLDEGIVPVAADPAQIEHVLLNLALNARDAMPEGGTLRMETARDDTEGEAGEWVLLRVVDTGHGMDEATVQQIFDPFFTTKEVGSGTGLGLATVYGIVRGCGGQVSCKSEPRRGTSFEIRLPGMPGASAAGEAGGTSTKAAHRGNETILLVDDEAFLLKVMRSNLEAHGYVIHTADSGEKAVEFFKEHSHEIQLVILDLGMPGMGGRTCLEKLLEIDSDARIIISSGYSAAGEREEMMESGARGFLVKPSGLPEILSKIDAVLSA
jgi:signal transduction histidine kinase